MSHFHPRLLARTLSITRSAHGLQRCDNAQGPSNSPGRHFRLDLDAVDGIQRDGLVCRARDRMRQRFARIGKDPRIVAGAAERDVELFAIDELAAARGVDVDENAIHRGALAGM